MDVTHIFVEKNTDGESVKISGGNVESTKTI
jgi:hypothetical protein